MIELQFKTADGPITIQVGAPTFAPEGKWPWAIEVRTNGRTQTLSADDPVAALEHTARFLVGYLSGREGLDPMVDEPTTRSADSVVRTRLAEHKKELAALPNSEESQPTRDRLRVAIRELETVLTLTSSP